MTVFSSRHVYEGVETTETSITRVGSPLDPTGSAQSRKIVTTANSQWLRPFKAEPYVAWNGVTNTNVTATVYGVVNGGLPNNDEIWMDVEYLTSTPFVPGITTITLDSASVTAATLSGGNLVVTNTGTTSQDQGARVSSIYGNNTGKYYFEVTLTTILGGSSISVGICTAASTYTGMGNNGTAGAMVAKTLGDVYCNGVQQPSATIGALVTGNIIAVAVDLDNRKIWFRKSPSGNWNGFASYNPATNTGGGTLPSGAMAPVITFGGTSGAAGNVLTANFGASAFSGAVPSGFTAGWVGPDTPANTLGEIVTTTKANFLVTGTAVTSDSSTWSNLASLYIKLDTATTTNVTISSDGFTATHNAAVSNSGARIIPYLSTGKYYFEVTVGAVNGSSDLIALVGSGTTYANAIVGQNCFLVSHAAGNIWSFNANTGKSIGAYGAGDVISFAVDISNSRGWIRKNAGNWNGDAAANPATDTNGQSFSVAPYSPAIVFGGSTPGNVGDNMTINTGASAYAQTPPVGFANWGGINPTLFKLTTTLSSPQPGVAGYIEARVRAAKPSMTYYIDPQIELSPSGATAGATAAYKTSRYVYEGTETTETSITRVNGAADPLGNKQSRKIVTTANSQWLRPFKVEPYAQWNNVTGANVTVAVYGTVNSGALPLNDEIWMDVEYLTMSSQPAATALDGPSANVTLSNGNLTVTRSNTTVGGVFSTTVVRSGKFYFEATIQVSNTDSTIGIDTPGVNPANNTTLVGVNLVAINNTIVGTSPSANLGNTTIGNIYSFAFDLTASLVWIRKNGGNWNANVSADPATGVGGLSITAGAGARAPHIFFANLGSSTDAVTANFGATAYAYIPPSGFGNWISAPAPLGEIVTTTKANVLATGTSVTSDGSSWNNTPLSPTFDPVTAVNTTLSNGNLTATHFNTTTTSGARVLLEHSSGKWYFEVTQSTTGHGATDIIAAIVPLSLAYGPPLVSATIGACCSRGGTVNANNTSAGPNLGTFNAGDVCGVAVNLDAGLVWFRKNAGNWNNDGTANPATGVGGVAITLPMPLLAPTVGYHGAGSVAGDAYTINLGATAYANSAPSGFVSWGTFTSFKLTTTLSSPQPGVAGYIHVRPRVGKASSTYYIDPQINLS